MVQPYRHQHSYTVKTALQQVVLVDNESALPVSSKRQRSAFPPNYVHSLDSTHMMMTATACNQQSMAYSGNCSLTTVRLICRFRFAAVHDSFWTHPCSVDDMNRILREKFVELHSQPLLETLAKSFIMRYPLCEIPPLPNRGTLNLHDVLKSPYFFD